MKRVIWILNTKVRVYWALWGVWGYDEDIRWWGGQCWSPQSIDWTCTPNSGELFWGRQLDMDQGYQGNFEVGQKRDRLKRFSRAYWKVLAQNRVIKSRFNSRRVPSCQRECHLDRLEREQRFAYDHSSSTKYSSLYTLVYYAVERVLVVVSCHILVVGSNEWLTSPSLARLVRELLLIFAKGCAACACQNGHHHLFRKQQLFRRDRFNLKLQLELLCQPCSSLIKVAARPIALSISTLLPLDSWSPKTSHHTRLCSFRIKNIWHLHDF